MKESAVSPVVGVMLMLIVTVIIAAVFGAMASGVFSADNTNTVTAELQFVKTNGDNCIFEMTAGNPFQLSQLRLVYSVRENRTKHQVIDAAEILAVNPGRTSVTIDNNHFLVPKPTFAYAADDYIICQFYDMKTGNAVCFGEIPGNNLGS